MGRQTCVPSPPLSPPQGQKEAERGKETHKRRSTQSQILRNKPRPKELVRTEERKENTEATAEKEMFGDKTFNGHYIDALNSTFCKGLKYPK